MYLLSLLTITYWITNGNGASVTLTVEGGVSLVGPHCPGTVRLFCEGVDLTVLRWRYNENIEIISYFPDRINTSQPAQLNFFRTQVAIDQNPHDTKFAKFSSFLTVDLQLLQANSIAKISCGTPGISKTEPVNVTIINPNIPSNPTITMVSAKFQNEKLNSIAVEWEKSNNYCPSHGLSFYYEVNITRYNSMKKKPLSCSGDVCIESFYNLTGRMEEFTVSIIAMNEIGTSDLVVYTTIITHQVQHYFIHKLILNDNQLLGECKAAKGFWGICTVQFTTGSLYGNLSDEVVIPLDTSIPILNNPVSTKLYYFFFSFVVNGTLQITDRIEYPSSTDFSTGFPGWGIALIIIILVVLICLILTIILIAVIANFTSKKNNNQNHEEQVNSNPVDQTPMEEADEITVSIKSWKLEYEPGFLPFTKRKYDMYKIDVKDKYFIYRSYSEFESLNDEVKMNFHFQSQDLDKLPKKKYFYVRENKFNSKNMEERRIGLEKFLINLIKIPGILEFPKLRLFLMLDDLQGLPA